MPGGAHLKKMIGAVIASRFDENAEGVELHEGDCYLLGDSGKHGNYISMMSAFCDPDGAAVAKTPKVLYVHYDQEDRHCVC